MSITVTAVLPYLHSTNHGSPSTVVFTVGEKNPRKGGPEQFQSVLFKDQL